MISIRPHVFPKFGNQPQPVNRHALFNEVLDYLTQQKKIFDFQGGVPLSLTEKTQILCGSDQVLQDVLQALKEKYGNEFVQTQDGYTLKSVPFELRLKDPGEGFHILPIKVPNPYFKK